MILRNLWRRRTRSFLTLLGIAIGVAAVVGLSALAQGFITNYASAVGRGSDILVSQADAIDIAYSNLDEMLGERLNGIPGVAAVDAGVYGWAVMEGMPFFLIFGYEPGSAAIEHYRIVAGHPLRGARQIILGREAADSLKKGVDDTIRFQGAPYRVVGIYETGQGMEESGGVVTLADAQEITQKERQVSLYQIDLQRGADAAVVIDRIETLDKGLLASKSTEYDANQQWLQIIQAFAWGIAAIAIVIGGLGMMNAMVMSVLERTREIGVLRALGWSRGRVVRMIMGEALALSLIGGMAGLGLGVLLARAAAQAPGIGGMLVGVFSPKILAQGVITALALGAVGGAYPAWAAARLLPVEALRYEGGSSGETRGRLARAGGQAFRNLWRRRTRTLISATGIGVGVGTLVMMGGWIDGISLQLNSLAGSAGAGNITVMQRDVADLSMSAVDERIVSQIQAMPRVKSVSPMVIGFVMTPEMPFFLIGGLDPNSAAMQHYALVAGRHVQRPNEMVMGVLAAKTYKVSIGDVMKLFENRYKIVGLVETGVAWEDGSAMLGLREVQRLMNRPRSVSFVFVDVARPTDAAEVAAAINHRFPDARASLSSEFAQNTDDMANAAAMFDAVGLLAMFVGGIVVANTMLMSVYERTREIGALRAVGWRKRHILLQILQESVWLCLLAALLGSIFGVLFLAGMEKVPVLGPWVTPAWNVATFARSIFLALLIGILASLYPAWRASRMQPVEALRYE